MSIEPPTGGLAGRLEAGVTAAARPEFGLGVTMRFTAGYRWGWPTGGIAAEFASDEPRGRGTAGTPLAAPDDTAWVYRFLLGARGEIRLAERAWLWSALRGGIGFYRLSIGNCEVVGYRCVYDEASF